ncbi:MAG: SiaB family protein kinase [Deltaproteobacteria bacterium]|nr:SiaB family protein kinase [Deltaproteobacteria bacterium]
MIAFDLFGLFNQLQKEGILFCFSGPTNQSVVESIGDALRCKMEREEAGMNVTQKVFAIFVEQMQNVVNYSAERVAGPPEAAGELRVGVVVVGREGGGFYVASGNHVSPEEARRLASQVDFLNSLDRDGMKAFYKEQRRGAVPEGSKGAGLGLVETARKASGPLECTITEPVAGGQAFFSLKAVI